MDISDRLKRFTAAVLEEVKCEAIESEKKIEEDRRAALEKAEKEAKEKCRALAASERAKFEHLYDMKMSEARLCNNAALYKAREEKTDEAFALITDKINSFTKSPEYAERLKKEISEAVAKLDSEDTVVAVRPCDIELLGDVPFKLSEGSFSLGGFTACSPKKALYIDETLDKKLEKLREDFISRYKISIIGG